MKTGFAVFVLALFVQCGVLGYSLNNQTYLTPLKHFMASRISFTTVDHTTLNLTNLRPLEEILTHNIQLISEDDMKKIDQALEITNSILEIGGAIEPLGVIFEPLAALENLVATLFKLRPQTDPVMEKLKEIQGQVSKLGDQMKQQFEELKAYITEESFSADIVQTASTLHRFMQDTIKYPGNDSITVFYQEYQKNRPISVGYKMLSLLKNPMTNPLAAALNADRLRKTSTYEKWSKILVDVMFQFVYIETFASGMFKNNSMYEFDRLVDGLTEVKQINEAWKVAFANAYWPYSVQELMIQVQNNYQRRSHGKKAMMLFCRDGLKELLQPPGIAYFAIVYDAVDGWRRHGFGGSNHLESFRLGDCNVAVMRTAEDWCPDADVDRAIDSEVVLNRHPKGDDWRCHDMLKDADTYNSKATANAFIVDGNTVVYQVGNVSPGRYIYKYGVLWIATY
ncbi:unnamed protein product [Caenorhabditis brenneri]